MNLPPGIYVQIYRGAYRGNAEQARSKLCTDLDMLHTLGLPGVVFHGFPGELETRWDSLATLAKDRGLAALASWGLDSQMSPSDKGARIGDVLAKPSCAGGLLDAEGAWDRDMGASDPTTARGAIILGENLRRKAPNAFVGDQPWFAMELHHGFPSEEFAHFVDERFPQVYVNDFAKQYGTQRYEKVFMWHQKQWASHETTLPESLRRPRSITIQGYRWDDILWALVDCLLTYRDRPVVMWSEPFPTPVTIACIKAALYLARNFAIVPGKSTREIVTAYQRIVHLTPDGLCGHDTLAAMGFPA